MKILKNKIVYEQEINNLKGKANLIVYPESLDELRKVVCTYRDIVPRGFGSSLVGGCLPKNSTIIDLSKMNKILDINSAKKIARVEAGVIVKDLNEELEEYGLEFPIETLFSGIETIGGIIAKNSPGKMEIKYGRASNWIDSLEIMNSEGEFMKIRKSDMGDYAGMEGITGIILGATLKLTQKKPRSLSILKSDNLKIILDATRKFKLDQDTVSVELINRHISQLLGMENKYHLFIEFEGDKGNFKTKEYSRFVKLKSKVYNKIAPEGYSSIENIKVFSDTTEDILIYLEENKIPYFSNIASGIFYLFFKPEDKIRRQAFLDFAKKQRAKISYNLGIGLTKKEYLPRDEAEIIRRVKRRLDKNSRFNNNKIIDSDLKEIELSQENLELEEKELTTEEKNEINEIEENLEQENERTEDREKEEPKENAQVNQEVNPRTMRPIEQKELTDEEKAEKEKIRKIASGLFGGEKP